MLYFSLSIWDSTKSALLNETTDSPVYPPVTNAILLFIYSKINFKTIEQ